MAGDDAPRVLPASATKSPPLKRRGTPMERSPDPLRATVPLWAASCVEQMSGLFGLT
jgi:hypothetical protein